MEFKTFPFFKKRRNNKCVREQYEKYFWNKFKPNFHKKKQLKF